MTLVLRRLRRDDEDQVLAAIRAMAADGGAWSGRYRPDLPWADYVDLVRAREDGKDPAEVAHAELVADVAGTIVGRVTLRFEMDDFHRRLGGPIGYLVLPQHRRRGHATAMLGLAVHVLRDRGESDPILVTCDDDNLASAAVIEANGGVLESVVPGVRDVPKRRYWIP